MQQDHMMRNRVMFIYIHIWFCGKINLKFNRKMQIKALNMYMVCETMEKSRKGYCFLSFGIRFFRCIYTFQMVFVYAFGDDDDAVVRNTIEKSIIFFMSL